MLKSRIKKVMATIVPIMIIGTSIQLKAVTAFAEVSDITVATSTAQVETTLSSDTGTVSKSSIASVATSTQTEAATASVSKSSIDLQSVNIPEKITANGQVYIVTSIGFSGLSGCSAESITLPNSITTIGDSAFSGCYNLTSITIPEGVTTIGNFAFVSCYDLKSITIPGVLAR